MEKTKLGLSALGVLAFLALVVAGTAYMQGNASGKWLGKGNMTGVHGAGRMYGAVNLTDLGLPANASREQISEALKAKQIQELGLPSDATNAQIMQAEQNKSAQLKAQIDSAIQSGDYATWKALVEQNPRGTALTAIITQDKFSTYVQMYQALKTAGNLREQLGLNNSTGFGKGMPGHGRMMPMNGGGF